MKALFFDIDGTLLSEITKEIPQSALDALKDVYKRQMRINESVEFLKSGVVDYEFRTTLCKELHGREEIEAIGKWLSGAKRYFLQNYRESDYVIDPRFSGYAREQLERFCEILRGKIETVEIRGVD